AARQRRGEKRGERRAGGCVIRGGCDRLAVGVEAVGLAGRVAEPGRVVGGVAGRVLERAAAEADRAGGANRTAAAEGQRAGAERRDRRGVVEGGSRQRSGGLLG